MNDNARIAVPHGQNVQDQMVLGGQPNEVHAQVAALAEQFRLFKLEIAAAEERGQANAIAKMQGQFALAAAANQAQEAGSERVVNAFEKLAAEMRANYASSADACLRLQEQLDAATQREEAMLAARLAAEQASQERIAALTLKLEDLESKYSRHKHEKGRGAPVHIGADTTTEQLANGRIIPARIRPNGDRSIYSIPIYYTEGPSVNGPDSQLDKPPRNPECGLCVIS